MIGEICYTSEVVTVASATNFNVEVDVSEVGFDNGSDYIRVYRIVDSGTTYIDEASGGFNSTTISESNIPVTSTIQIQICFDNNHWSDNAYASEIRLTEACTTPTAVCQDITVALVDGSASITTGDIDNGSTYSCGLQSMSLDQTSFDCNDIGDNTVTLTVTDNNSDFDQCTATVTVTGSNNPPVANCQDITVNLSGGSATISALDIDNGSTADCGINSTSIDITDFDCTDIGANTVTLTVEDNIGQQTTCTATVTVNDPGLPNAVCQDITVDVGCSGSATITANDINNGSSAACGINSTSIDITTFTTADVGDNAVTFTVEDNGLRTDQCTATVTVTNTGVPPVAVCQDITVDMGCGSSVSITTGDIDNGSTYDCGLQSMSLSQSSFSAAGSYNVTLTVTDNNSNTDQCTASVTVTSTGGTAPTFSSCPSDVTMNNDPGECYAVYSYTTPTAPDITVNGFDENYAECFWTITDGSGDASSDADVDFSSAPTSVLLTSNDIYGFLSFKAAYAEKTINCDATISFDWDYYTDGSGFFGNVEEPFYTTVNGSTTIHTYGYNVDQSGSFTVNLSAGDVFGFGIFSASGNGGPEVVDITNFQVIETTDVTMTAGLASGSQFPVGTTTVSYLARNCGGTDNCSFDVTVLDVEVPTISCPSNISSRGTDSGQCYATVTGIAPTVVENCPTVTYTLTGATTGSGSDDASGTQFNLGTTTVTYTVTDDVPNTATCNFTIEVVDDENPSITCPSALTAQCDISEQPVYASYAAFTAAGGSASDNCNLNTSSFTHVSDVSDGNTCPEVITRTYRIADDAGNTNTCTQTITIDDTTDPTASNPAAISVRSVLLLLPISPSLPMKRIIVPLLQLWLLSAM